MAELGQRRKLSAILSADVVGYSRLMQDDEAATVATLKQHRLTLSGVIQRRHGRVVNAPGDNILAELPSAVEAVQAAVEIQNEIEGLNEDLPDERKMRFRIGLNLGDVIEEEDGTIYGDGVNVAARMESLAEPGGIYVSSKVLEEVEGKFELGFESLGEQKVKNIEKPILVYRVKDNPDRPAEKRSAGANKNLRIAAAGAFVLVATAALIFIVAFQSGHDEGIAFDDVLTLPTGPTIAVLPFDNMSGDPEQEYLSDGITEDIITRLAHSPRYFVIARNSTSQYKGQSIDVRKVRTELGADYVVEGSVRKAGSTVRVTAQLIDAKDGTHMWAKTFDRDLTTADLFRIQDEITGRVAVTIADARGVLTLKEIEAIRSRPANSLDAYECVLRAVAYYGDEISPKKHAEVRACLERAVEVDPEYADAWAFLGFIYTDEDRFGFNPREGSLDRALSAAEESIRLNPKGEFGLMSIALVRFHRHELDQFYEAADRATANNPNNAWQIAAIADWLFWSGEIERGYGLMKKAAALNPNHAGWYYFVFEAYHYLKGDYETALDYAVKIQMPEFFWTQAHLAAIYAQLGRKEEAEAAVQRLLNLYPNFENDFYDLVGSFNQPPEIYLRYLDRTPKAEPRLMW